MGKLQRWGTLITNVNIHPPTLDKIDWKYYHQKVVEYEKKKIVYVVPVKDWAEQPLCEWFTKNYGSFGFDEIIIEKTQAYEKIKEKTGFIGTPDFLVKQGNKWLRLEVEVFSAQYKTHNNVTNFADFLLCYDVTSPVEKVKTLTVKEQVGCEEIINLDEIPKFLYVYDSEFKKEYDQIERKKYLNTLRKT